jgi:hypothetical protein
LLQETKPGLEPTRGLVLNRSSGGLGLSMPQPASEGAVFGVRIAQATDAIPWVWVVVKHCRPLTNRWLLGCQFVEPPAPDLLRLFR